MQEVGRSESEGGIRLVGILSSGRCLSVLREPERRNPESPSPRVPESPNCACSPFALLLGL